MICYLIFRAFEAWGSSNQIQVAISFNLPVPLLKMIWDLLIWRYCHVGHDLQACRVQATSRRVFFSWIMTCLDFLNMSFLDVVTFPRFGGLRGFRDLTFLIIPRKSINEIVLLLSPPPFVPRKQQMVCKLSGLTQV